MQFAERWLGIGSVVVALAGLGTLAVQLAPHRHHHHHGMRAHFDFGRVNCRGLPAIQTDRESIDEVLLRGQEPDPYAPILSSAETAKCLTTSARVEMLIEIAADGHVKTVSHRPERPTAESRCIAKAVRGLTFPASPTGITLRNVFTR